MADEKLGVVLLNMGGPDALDDVPPYLLNIFRDPFILDMPLGFLVRPWLSRIIVKKRAQASADRYRQIGGKTPLNGIAENQAVAIKKALAQRGIEAVVEPGMRYWHPFTAEAVARLANRGVHRVVALSMYPAYSHATSGSSFADFQRAVKAHLPKVPVSRVEHWAALPAYVDFLTQRTVSALDSLGTAQWPRTAVLFSAHSVPVKLIERGDPYQNHIEQTCRLVCDRLPNEIKTALGWQSAVGPAKWLEPDSKSLAATLRHQGIEHLVVVPLGFVAENIETLWDIEIDLKSHARELGFQGFVRVDCPNDDASVMDGLAELITAAIG
jgi:ferrochelatase